MPKKKTKFCHNFTQSININTVIKLSMNTINYYILFENSKICISQGMLSNKKIENQCK